MIGISNENEGGKSSSFSNKIFDVQARSYSIGGWLWSLRWIDDDNRIYIVVNPIIIIVGWHGSFPTIILKDFNRWLLLVHGFNLRYSAVIEPIFMKRWANDVDLVCCSNIFKLTKLSLVTITKLQNVPTIHTQIPNIQIKPCIHDTVHSIILWIQAFFKFWRILTLNMKIETLVHEISERTVIQTLP